MKSYFFTETPDSFSVATVGWQKTDEALWGVKDGYKNAADSLVDFALQEGARNHIRVLDTYIFPIMFLYRQSLEVSLKLIYHRFCGKIQKGGHNLVCLWDEVENVVVKQINSEDFLDIVRKYKENFLRFSTEDIDFREIREIFCEFQYIDKESDVWRYFVDKSSKVYINETQYIDYNNLKTVMSKLYEILDYLYDIVSEYLSG